MSTTLKRFVLSEEWKVIKDQIEIMISNIKDNLVSCDIEKIMLFRGKIIAYREMLELPETLIQTEVDYEKTGEEIS